MVCIETCALHLPQGSDSLVNQKPGKQVLPETQLLFKTNLQPHRLKSVLTVGEEDSEDVTAVTAHVALCVCVVGGDGVVSGF